MISNVMQNDIYSAYQQCRVYIKGNFEYGLKYNPNFHNTWIVRKHCNIKEEWIWIQQLNEDIKQKGVSTW